MLRWLLWTAFGVAPLASHRPVEPWWTDVRSQDPFDADGPSGRRTSPGRVPPHDIQAEESLLGAMLLSRDAVASASESGDVGLVLQARPRPHLRRDEHADGPWRARRPGDRRRRAAPRRPARPLGGPSVLFSLQANTPATSNAAATPRSSRTTRCCVGSSRSQSEISELGYSLPDDVIKTLDDRRDDGLRPVAEPHHRLDRRAARPAARDAQPHRDALRPRRRDHRHADRATPTSTTSPPGCSPRRSSSSALVPPWARRPSRSAWRRMRP